jgi:hypothetical protein
MVSYTYNVYSPINNDDYDGFGNDGNVLGAFEQAMLTLIRRNSLNGRLNNSYFNFNNVSVNMFSYAVSANDSKKQTYTIRIRNMDEALMLACMLLDREKIAYLYDNLRGDLKKTYDLLVDADFVATNHLFDQIYDELNMWYEIERRQHPNTRGEQIRNPRTNRFIYDIRAEGNRQNYKSIFGKIKLRRVVYDELENYHTVNYVVNDYCVINYLESRLLKSEYNIIKEELNEIKTPTYPELTMMLNKIDYNLNVYILDGEQIQKQEQFNKTLNIMVHNCHMYVLFTNGKSFKKHFKKMVEIDNKKFSDIKTPEIYNDNFKIIDGIKYKKQNFFNNLDKKLASLRTPFSHNNMEFFSSCGIRPVRYYNNNEDVKLVQALDINSCYQNIMYNEKYIMPQHDGTEETTIYNKTDKIEIHGYYFVEWLNKDEIFNILFGTQNKLWIFGDLIMLLKIQKKIKIIYKHIPSNYTQYNSIKPYTKEERKERKIVDTLYTGILGMRVKHKSVHYKCSGEEAQALYYKHKDNEIVSVDEAQIYTTYKGDDNKKKQKTQYFDNDEEKQNIINECSKLNNADIKITDTNIKIHNEYFLQSAGLYAYLAIISYARYQLYQIYCEVKKIHPNIIVKKVYTDSITFNHKLSDDMTKFVNDINKKLEKQEIAVKPEISNYKWIHREVSTEEPIIKPKQEIKNHSNLKDLLDYEMSFCINSRAGYGKSYTLNNVIIPYFNRNNLSYRISSTTISDAKNHNSQTINSLIACNDASLNSILNEFKNVDYLVIDECSRLTMNLINVLQFLKKNNNNIKFIFLGDQYQCQYNSLNKNIMNINVFLDLVDYNFFNIQWHDKARYNKNYDEFLNKLITLKKSEERINHIKSYFKNQIKKIGDEDNNKIKIAYTNKTADKIKGHTVHSFQGMTIEENMSVYDIDKSLLEVAYTALSRTTNPNLISIFI